jgi:hypothetical protein
MIRGVALISAMTATGIHVHKNRLIPTPVEQLPMKNPGHLPRVLFGSDARADKVIE